MRHPPPSFLLLLPLLLTKASVTDFGRDCAHLETKNTPVLNLQIYISFAPPGWKKMMMKLMSTTIIYNPRLGADESRTGRIRRSRKRPLGEAASSPSSILARKIRRWRCVVAAAAAAAARIFSATGQKPCTIPAQQHRPRGSPNQERGGQPRRATASPASLLSLSLALFPFFSLSVFFFSLDPPGGQHAAGPEAVYSRGEQPWKRRKKNPTSGALLSGSPASTVSRRG